MKNYFIYTVLLILFSINSNRVHAQQTPVFSNYNYNTVVLNPAHAGYYDMTDITLTNSGYLNGVEGSPKNFDLSVNMLTRSEKIGLAAGITRDEIGVTSTTTFFASYSYKIKFDEEYGRGIWWAYNPNIISFGLTTGGTIYNENLTELGLETDPEFQENLHSFNPTLGIGFLYSRDKIYFGLSSPNLLSGTFNSKNNTNFNNVYYSYFGLRLFTNQFQEVLINPSFLLKYTEGAPFQADINVLANYKNKFEIGGGYRTSNAINLLAGFHVGNNFRVIFTYNKSLDAVEIPDQYGIVLNYRFGEGFGG